MTRFVGAALFAAVPIAPAFANDALKGRWVGSIGGNQLTLTIQNAQGGTLTGSIASAQFNYTVSGAPPNATNGQGTFQGNSVNIKTPGGNWAMQLQANQLKGLYTPDSTRGRSRDILLTKQ